MAGLKSKTGKPAVMCNECNPPKPIAETFIYSHRRKVHGYRTPRGGVTVGDRRFTKKAGVKSPAQARAAEGLPRLPGKKSVKKIPEKKQPARPAATAFTVTANDFKRVENMVLLRSTDGGLWLAERLK